MAADSSERAGVQNFSNNLFAQIDIMVCEVQE